MDRIASPKHGVAMTTLNRKDRPGAQLVGIECKAALAMHELGAFTYASERAESWTQRGMEIAVACSSLIADNARLRSALKNVVDHADGMDIDGNRRAADADPMRNWTRVIDRARAALKGAQ